MPGHNAEGLHEILEKGVAIPQKALQAGQAYLGGEFGVPCRGHCGADIQALAAVRAGIQGQTLRETEG